MKRLIAACAMAVGVATASYAQTSLPLVADIPFAFYVGDAQMSAGEYRVEKLSGHWMIKVVSVDGSEAAMRLVFGSDAKETPKTHALIFRKYGEDRYFLGEIRHEGERVGTEVPRSKKEREAVTSTLVSSTRPTTVMILARAR